MIPQRRFLLSEKNDSASYYDFDEDFRIHSRLYPQRFRALTIECHFKCALEVSSVQRQFCSLHCPADFSLTLLSLSGLVLIRFRDTIKGKCSQNLLLNFEMLGTSS